MARICRTPRQAGAPLWACARVGRIVEWVVKQDYCFSKAGGCDQFELGGSGTDFFDENSTTTRCRFLANFLAAHTPSLDAGFISGSCEARKKPVDPDDDENERFAVPDIITHEPGVRMEFYEIKPNSISGRRAGREKVETFLSLVDFLKESDSSFPGYERGIQFDPDRSIVFYRRNYLGIVPCEVALHYRRCTESGLESGLIVYEICVEVNGELLEALAKAIIVSAVIAALVLLAAAAAEALGGIILAPALLVFDSPLGNSVGREAVNDLQDVRYVQALTADWRVGVGGEPVAVDGVFGEETAGAIADFQTSSGLDETAGTVIPGSATCSALESAHLEGIFTAADFSGLSMDGLGDRVFREDPDGVDQEAEEVTDTQTAFNGMVQQYLLDLHDNV